MKLIKARDYEDMSKKAAALIQAQVTIKPDSVLGLATGSTPIGTYEQLVEHYRAGELDFSQVRTVNLDEYRGLNRTNPQSYYFFMQEHLFSHINVSPDSTFIPDGTNDNAEAVCTGYEETIRSLGGVDLRLLDLGNNGHIGFNEPGEVFEKETHCVNLTKSTIEANARFFESVEEVPTQAYTMGIQTIMKAKKILVIVNGAGKGEIVKKAFFGPVTPEVPASILQMHPDVTVIADETACAMLEQA